MLAVCDYFTGVLAAAIKHELSSEVGFRRQSPRRCVSLCWLVLPTSSTHTDPPEWSGHPYSSGVLYFLANEGLSCLENAAVIGLPVPEKLKEMLAQLKEERENKDD
ncbi:MAG: phage holin family protein [Subdoligranulum sp.]